MQYLIDLFSQGAVMKIFVTIVITTVPIAYKQLGIADSLTLMVVAAVATAFGVYAMSAVATQKIEANAVSASQPGPAKIG